MPNAENLKVPTSKEARKNGRKGGKASVKARQEKKTMREQCKMLMSMDISDANPKMKATLKKLGITDNDTQYSAAIVAAMLQKAIQGDVKAAEWITKMCGEDVNEIIRREQLALDKQRLELELAKLESQLKETASEGTADDGFMEAMNGYSEDVWKGEGE